MASRTTRGQLRTAASLLSIASVALRVPFSISLIRLKATPHCRATWAWVSPACLRAYLIAAGS